MMNPIKDGDELQRQIATGLSAMKQREIEAARPIAARLVAKLRAGNFKIGRYEQRAIVWVWVWYPLAIRADALTAAINELIEGSGFEVEGYSDGMFSITAFFKGVQK